MEDKNSSSGKNPLSNKEFLSRLVQLEEKLMSDNYDYLVIQELVITYTVTTIYNERIC